MPLTQHLANVVLIAHMAYVAFVVFGLLLIWLGGLCRWSWVRNRWFRGIHLLMITIVVVETWLDITCPLTTWENALRAQAGQDMYDGDWIAIWLRSLLFFDLPTWVFTCGYTLFGLLVVLSLQVIPPRWKVGLTSQANPVLQPSSDSETEAGDSPPAADPASR
ncbi:DUF2784 family protein [bacterium]|nr:DUF2784 family protein [bacterium]